MVWPKLEIELELSVPETARNIYQPTGIYHQKQLHIETNRPFPSSCLSLLQSESKCEVFVMVICSTWG